MAGKRQMTMAKRAREQAVKERRALKAAKKQERKRAAESESVGDADLPSEEGESTRWS